MALREANRPWASARRIGALGLLVALVAGACSGGTASPTVGSSAASTPSAAPTASAALEPYVFAALLPLTGSVAQYGIGASNGYALAVAEANAAGGINGHQVVLKLFDDQCDPTVGATAASLVVSDPTKFTGVLASLCSSADLAELPILTRAGYTVIGTGSSPLITAFIKKGGTTYNNWTRMGPNDNGAGISVGLLAVQILKYQKVAVLYSSDDYGQGILLNLEQTISLAGGTEVAKETYTPNTTKDFTPQLTKIKAANPDALILVGYFSDTGVAVAQLSRVGLSGIPIVATQESLEPGYYQVGGKDAEGTYMPPNWWPTDPSQANTTFVADYTKKYGVAPDTFAAFPYTAIEVFLHSLQAGATPDTLAAMDRAASFDSPIGPVKIDQYGNLIAGGTTVVQVKGGAFVPDTTLGASLGAAVATFVQAHPDLLLTGTK